MKKSGVIVFIILIWIPSMIGARLLSAFYCFTLLLPPKDPEIPEIIASRIGVQADWDKIQDYLSHGSIKVGMHRNEVLGIIDQIGPYRIEILYPFDNSSEDFNVDLEPFYQENIYFIDDLTNRELGVWYFDYDFGILTSFYREDLYLDIGEGIDGEDKSNKVKTVFDPWLDRFHRGVVSHSSTGMLSGKIYTATRHRNCSGDC